MEFKGAPKKTHPTIARLKNFVDALYRLDDRDPHVEMMSVFSNGGQLKSFAAFINFSHSGFEKISLDQIQIAWGRLRLQQDQENAAERAKGVERQRTSHHHPWVCDPAAALIIDMLDVLEGHSEQPTLIVNASESPSDRVKATLVIVNLCSSQLSKTIHQSALKLYSSVIQQDLVCNLRLLLGDFYGELNGVLNSENPIWIKKVEPSGTIIALNLNQLTSSDRQWIIDRVLTLSQLIDDQPKIPVEAEENTDIFGVSQCLWTLIQIASSEQACPGYRLIIKKNGRGGLSRVIIAANLNSPYLPVRGKAAIEGILSFCTAYYR